jgi:thioesterase domain-containing protein
VPLADLVKGPTIEQLATSIRSGISAHNGRLVAIQTDGTKRPLFLLQGTLQIARHLPPDRPFYTCIPHGEDGLPVPATLSEIAADYIREIRELQPQGPYIIGGFSFGGLVAFEIVQQLKSASEVAMLVMIDPTLPWSSRDALRQPASTERQTPRSLRQKIRLLQRRCRAITNAVKWALCNNLVPIWTRLPKKPYALRKFYFLEASQRVAQKYAPEPYQGDAILIQSKKASGWAAGWRNLITGTLHVHELPGNHIEIVTGQNAAAVAEVLQRYL